MCLQWFFQKTSPGKKENFPPADLFWIKVLQGAGGGVPGVGKQAFASLFASLVNPQKVVLADIGFSPNLQGLLVPHLKGNHTDSAAVFGDIITLVAVTPGDRPDKSTVFVD